MGMLVRSEGQAAVWVLFAAAGFAAALLTDALRACSEAGWTRIAAGFCSGVLTAALAGAMALFTTNGQARLYMLAAMLCGAALYTATLGALLHLLGRRCACLGRKVWTNVCACRFVNKLFK